MATKQSGTMNFHMEGEGLTRLYRDFWQSDPGYAMMAMKKGFIGVSKEIAIAFFRGKLKIVGDTRVNPDLKMVEDNSEIWPSPEEAMTIAVNNIIYDSAALSALKTDTWATFRKEIVEQRVEEGIEDIWSVDYSDSEYEYYQSVAKGIKDESRRLQTAINKSLRTLNELSKVIDFMPQFKDMDIKPMAFSKFDEETIGKILGKVEKAMRQVEVKETSEDDLTKLKKETAELRQEADKIKGEIKAEKKVSKRLKASYDKNGYRIVQTGDITEHDSGWLDPKGKFYPCAFASHSTTAVEILKGEGGERDLEDEGWIKMSARRFYAGYDDTTLEVRKPSKKQTAVIVDWLMSNKFQSIEYNHVTYSIEDFMGGFFDD